MADDLVQRLRMFAKKPRALSTDIARASVLGEVADALARKDAEIADLRKTVESQEDALDEVMKERDWAQDCLQETHIALGGDGEWTGKIPAELPPNSGDLHYDVPVLAAEVKQRAERAEVREREAQTVTIAQMPSSAFGVFVLEPEWVGKRVALVLLDTEEAK